MSGSVPAGFPKKVEYLELIYDLIFVYLLGRCNLMLLDTADGFFTASTFGNYLVSSLVILQIWYFSTLIINRYGRNGVWEHLLLLVNMYLLYYMSDGTRLIWGGYFIRYHMGWGFILVNLAVQYALLWHRVEGETEKAHIRRLPVMPRSCSVPFLSSG